MKSAFLLAGFYLSFSYLEAAPAERVLPTRHVIMPLRQQATVTAAGATLPMWQGTDGTYTYTMVGRNPAVASSSPTTTISVPVVPLKLVFSDGTTFDPTVVDNTCSPAGSALSLLLQSPLFNNSSYTPGGTSVGSTQYEDFFQRADFWNYTNPSGANPNYHLLLSAAALNPITVNVPAGSGKATPATCGKLGQVDLGWFDTWLQSTVYPQAGVLPAEFPIFLLYNVVTYEPSQPNSYILGYHSAFAGAATGGATQIYAVGEFDTTGNFGATKDISDLTHELGEGLNDPLGTNPTPPWGNVGQVSGCQNNLEVGDPLSGTNVTITMSNTYVYHLQELAFVSWFFHDSPSTGVNGWYSSNGTFLTSAAPCGGASAPTTTSLTLSSTTAGTQASFTIVVIPSSSSITATPTGSVTLVSSTGSTLGGPYTLNDGSASGMIALPVGTYTIAADYTGSASFKASNSSPVTIAASPSTQLKATVTTFTVGTTTLPQGGQDSITIQVSPAAGTGTPTGTVKLVSSTAGTIASLPLANGAFTGSISLPAGTYTITSEYTGDSTYAASNASPVTINPSATPALKPTVTTLSLSSTAVPAGGALATGVIHVTSLTAVATPTGTVKVVSSAGTTLATFTLTSGSASGTVSLPAGSYTVTAQYGGDTNFAPSTSAPVAINPPTMLPGQGQLTLSTTSLAFGNAAVGTITAAQTVTVTNAGTSQAILLAAITGADPQDFTRTSTCSFSLGAGKSCAFQISFRPTTAGARTANLTVGGLTAASQQQVALSGTGTGGPRLKLSLISLNFGTSPVGTATGAQSVTITNTGTAALTGLFAALNGADPHDFTATSTCGLSVAPAASCTVSIVFQPIAAGVRTATLEVLGQGTGAAQTVTLTGTGTGGPQLMLSAASLAFETSTAPQTITVSNPGTAALTALSVFVEGPDPRDFPVTGGCGFSLASGGTCSIEVTFTPRAAGTRSATLLVNAGLSGLSATVSLSGTGN